MKSECSGRVTCRDTLACPRLLCTVMSAKCPSRWGLWLQVFVPLSTHLTGIGFRGSLTPLNDLFVCRRASLQRGIHTLLMEDRHQLTWTPTKSEFISWCTWREMDHLLTKKRNVWYENHIKNIYNCFLTWPLQLYELAKWFWKWPSHTHMKKFSFLVPAEGKVLPIVLAPTLKDRSAFKLTNTFWHSSLACMLLQKCLLG